MVKYTADLHGMDQATYEKRRDEIFTKLGMHDFAGERIAKFFSGMRQKFSIVMTIIHDPPAIGFMSTGSHLLRFLF